MQVSENNWTDNRFGIFSTAKTPHEILFFVLHFMAVILGERCMEKKQQQQPKAVPFYGFSSSSPRSQKHFSALWLEDVPSPVSFLSQDVSVTERVQDLQQDLTSTFCCECCREMRWIL